MSLPRRFPANYQPTPTCLHPNGKRKKAYRSRAKAKQATVRHTHRVTVYRCERCGVWHLTSEPKPATLVELTDGYLGRLTKPPEQAQHDIDQALAGGYDDIKWADFPHPIALRRIRRVLPADQQQAA